MRWSIEQGKKKRRKPTADQVALLASKPVLNDGGFLIASAYAQVSTCRSFGMMGIGPIPITAVWEWEDRNGVVDHAVRSHFEAVITAIDVSTMKRANKPNSPPAPKEDNTKKPKRSRKR